MPWQLTTPVNAGDLDPAGTYAQIKIVMQQHLSNQEIISLGFEYGNTVSDVWVPGVLPIGLPTSAMISGADYTTLVTTHASIDGELTYVAVKRGLYEYLAANSIIAAGTVV